MSRARLLLVLCLIPLGTVVWFLSRDAPSANSHTVRPTPQGLHVGQENDIGFRRDLGDDVDVENAPPVIVRLVSVTGEPVTSGFIATSAWLSADATDLVLRSGAVEGVPCSYEWSGSPDKNGICEIPAENRGRSKDLALWVVSEGFEVSCRPLDRALEDGSVTLSPASPWIATVCLESGEVLANADIDQRVAAWDIARGAEPRRLAVLALKLRTGAHGTLCCRARSTGQD